jgi:hypothetical protein
MSTIGHNVVNITVPVQDWVVCSDIRHVSKQLHVQPLSTNGRSCAEDRQAF